MTLASCGVCTRMLIVEPSDVSHVCKYLAIWLLLPLILNSGLFGLELPSFSPLDSVMLNWKKYD
jgi:hypothetical protein